MSWWPVAYQRPRVFLVHLWMTYARKFHDSPRATGFVLVLCEMWRCCGSQGTFTWRSNCGVKYRDYKSESSAVYVMITSLQTDLTTHPPTDIIQSFAALSSIPNKLRLHNARHPTWLPHPIPIHPLTSWGPRSSTRRMETTQLLQPSTS